MIEGEVLGIVGAGCCVKCPVDSRGWTRQDRHQEMLRSRLLSDRQEIKRFRFRVKFC